MLPPAYGNRNTKGEETASTTLKSSPNNHRSHETDKDINLQTRDCLVQMCPMFLGRAPCGRHAGDHSFELYLDYGKRLTVLSGVIEQTCPEKPKGL